MLSLKNIYLKEIKADYDYDKEDDEDAFGDILPDDDELKPGEIDSMGMDLTQHDKGIKKLLNKNTGYMDLPSIINTIKDEKVKKIIEPILKKWQEALGSDKNLSVKLSPDVIELTDTIVKQSWFYKHNKDPKSKKYIFQTKKFNNRIKELDNKIKTSINSIKGSVDKKNKVLKAYNELYNNIMKVKKDQELAIRIKETIKKEIQKLSEEGSLEDKLKGAFSPEEMDKINSKKVPGFADLKPEPKEKKSKFKKAGEQMGFDMRGLK